MKKINTTLLLTFLPILTLAAEPFKYEELPNAISTADDILGKMEKIGNWMFSVLMALAVIFIVIAAFKYLTSGGGDKTKEAHKALGYAVVAVIIGVLSKGIVYAIEIFLK